MDKRMRGIVVAAFAIGLSTAALGADGPGVTELTADQIVAKNVAARGGAESWRKIETMVWVGHLESEHAPLPSMPFVMQQKRPNKTRFEISAMGKRTVRTFDGAHGWKEHPTGEGPDVKSFAPQETTFAFRAPGIDGPLIDYEAKRNTVALEGVEEVEGRKAYRLKVTLASGETDHLWVDAVTFLELRYDRPSYGRAGTPQTVSVFYRDYRTIEGGLQVPSVVETAVGVSQTRDRMVIERFLPNTPLDDRAFARPGGPERRGGVALHGAPKRNFGGQAAAPAAPAPATAAEPPAAPAAASPDTASGSK